MSFSNVLDFLSIFHPLLLLKNGVGIMATNFKILIHRNSDNLHVKLSGDFDGSSAYQLVNTLEKYGRGVFTIFIHTAGLRHIYPFGQDVLRSDLGRLRTIASEKIMFTGPHAAELAPNVAHVAWNV
jgi:hypothetical protein